MCDFFLEFCANMYMVAIISIKHIDNEIIKSMYMMVKHVHELTCLNCENIMYNLCTCSTNIYIKLKSCLTNIYRHFHPTMYMFAQKSKKNALVISTLQMRCSQPFLLPCFHLRFSFAIVPLQSRCKSVP